MTSATPLEDAIRAKVCHYFLSLSCDIFSKVVACELFSCLAYHSIQRMQVTAAFNPQTLEIYNDSHLHSHHRAMQGRTSRETHFRYVPGPQTRTAESSLTNHRHLSSSRLVITSEAFKSKLQPARHRMVYALLRDEMALEGGIHALQLKTLTPEEEERQMKKKAAGAEANDKEENSSPNTA